MKQYVITDADIERLHQSLARDPARGREGYGMQEKLTEQERSIHERAHRFYNYQICRWVNEVTK